ncbi:hypothetical protein DENIS_3593 [Desulfonema ishimotonii]|uniref:Uncharacterized protein n=1 Tax=Desulfonema ishimotonii TaxID=45657 RepID=A0A401G086_9BACT|nr:hypothetical protein DENIS_3593 [Desulfonema ishimotonii]
MAPDTATGENTDEIFAIGQCAGNIDFPGALAAEGAFHYLVKFRMSGADRPVIGCLFPHLIADKCISCELQ